LPSGAAVASVISGGDGSASATETKTRIGGRLIAGVDIHESYYVELAYNLTGKVADARTDSLTLSAGARF
jgi:hypothetical protein